MMTPQEVAELIEALEGEVNNGGFHQFFYNSAGDNTMETIQTLETIGAPVMAGIVRRAAAMFPGDAPPKATAFEELDDEFYAYLENLSELLRKYRTR